MGNYHRDIKIALKVIYEDNFNVSYEVTSYGALSRLDLSFKPFSKTKPFEYVYINVKGVEKILSEEDPYKRYLVAKKVFDENFDSSYKATHKINESEEQILKDKYFKR